MVAADMDLESYSGMLNGPACGAHCARTCPRCAWTEWQHQLDSVITLPSGTECSTNRGAEQGDFWAPVRADWSRARHAKLTCRTIPPLPLHKEELATSSTSMMDRCLTRNWMRAPLRLGDSLWLTRTHQCQSSDRWRTA